MVRCETAKALNSIFQQWGISAPVASWNISGEPCSGTAIDSTDMDREDSDVNYPGIKCNCSLTDGSSTCHITQLKLDQNYLTGPLPAFLGNLSRLRMLSVGTNALSGTIPKELGGLQNLRILAFGSNYFSGSLPPQLGLLVNLEHLAKLDSSNYIDSAGLGGEIPTELANLVNLQTMWASDNPFTGKLPDFIGNWTKLTSLRFQGNSFEGPIPSSYSSLTWLNDLRISDLSNVSSSLDFVKDMKNLTVLILRNNLLSGNIPDSFGEYEKLQRLDFSFNNLSGQIPSSLFNLNSLSYLFLGNNSLSGTIPPAMSRFPAMRRLITVNVVANNLTFDSNNSFLASRLDCLQRQFPCNRVSPRYSSFAINCGGPQKTSTDGTIYEAESSTLGPASYYVEDSTRWAVSNVVLFYQNAQYIQNTLGPIRGTLDPELFQTARLSPGSLRYYGLGLENGKYNVNLQFAETGFDDESLRTWQSLGRRVFDIYIQGSLQIKDFNIRSAAGGAINKVVLRDFKVQVSENFLEIHLFWAGKGTCCIPVQAYYGPSISAIRVTPADFRQTVSDLPPTSSAKSRTGIIVGVTLPIVLLMILCPLAIFYRRRKASSSNDDEELLVIDNRPNAFSYAELKTATEDFSPTNKLGEGAFGPVYKRNSREETLGNVTPRESQFVAEVSIISAVQHRNLVKLYGSCIQGENRLLVYEYLRNKSLDQALFGNNLNGYLAPEYAMLGHLTEKADVFGFGVVALEILCGRPNANSSLEPERMYLLEWAWNLYENNHGLELVDPILNSFNKEEAIRLLGVGLLCTQASPTMRPPMSRVVAMLTGDIEVSTVASRPGYLTDWQFNDMSIFNGSPETSTSEAPLHRSNSLSSASKVSGADYSPTMVTQAMSH
ncbi:hypothetical protein IFM89_002638 [Coptis chinensis]|uniref:non-specific serine/threonine protein kinase n=1 Tax=Coptis chinensis TaxID=261450 RepID=A0A835GX17_9MAGN|nr:hypothetical protein IFM89_002638 [Coptis chinensis]